MAKNNEFKDTFIETISKMSPEEINQIIRQKGKKPKLVKPFIKVYDYMEENNYEKN